jgi:hypothetical protein
MSRPHDSARPRRATWRFAALGLALAASLDPGTAVGMVEAPEPTAAPEAAAEVPATPTPPTADPGEGLPLIDEAALLQHGPLLQDAVLPCGLRVIVAQDESLPVAAVVLAIETGTEDDPPTQPGLVHALAYHLLQGNRELRPAGAPALVHDQGGIAGIAVGPAQVRYESLVPISGLADALWVESQRLRAPSVSAELWTGTLRWARRDTARAWRAPRAAMAAAHGAPGLEHDGRTVTSGLDTMVPRAISQALTERFRYEDATLVVVSPHPPPELRERIEALFSELPAQPRHARDRSPRWRTGTAPQALAIAGEKAHDARLVWPVAPDPASLVQATVWCKALNRQRRHGGEPSRAHVRCHLDVDPRRATLIVQASGVDDPIALVQARLLRLEQGEDAPLVERLREDVLREEVQQLRGPLPLARRLAATAIDAPPQPRSCEQASKCPPGGTGEADLPTTPEGWHTRPVAALTGLAVLAQPWLGRGFGPRLQPGAAIQLVPEPNP